MIHLGVSKDFARFVELITSEPYNFDVNAQRDSDACTPMHLAMFYKKVKVAEKLRELGADLSIKNSYGEACDEKFEKLIASKGNIIWLDLEMTGGFYEMVKAQQDPWTGERLELPTVALS